MWRFLVLAVITLLISTNSGCGTGGSNNTISSSSSQIPGVTSQNNIEIRAKIILPKKCNTKEEAAIKIILPNGATVNNFDELYTQAPNLFDLSDELKLTMEFWQQANPDMKIFTLHIEGSKPDWIYVGGTLNRKIYGRTLTFSMTDNQVSSYRSKTQNSKVLCTGYFSENNKTTYLIWDPDKQENNIVLESDGSNKRSSGSLKLPRLIEQISCAGWISAGGAFGAIVLGAIGGVVGNIGGVITGGAIGAVLGAAAAFFYICPEIIDAQDSSPTPPSSNTTNNGNQSGPTPEPTPLVDGAVFLTWPGNPDSPVAPEFNEMTKKCGEEFWIDFWAKNSDNSTWEAGKYYFQNNFAARGFGDFPDHIYLDHDVKPGEVWSKRFIFHAPYSVGTYCLTSRMGKDPYSEFGNYINWNIKITGPAASYVTQGPVEHPGRFDVAFGPGETRTLWVRLTNSGDVPWSREGSNPVHLGTACPQDRSSIFFGNQNLRSYMVEDRVMPGETATFQISINAPPNPGVYEEKFRLVMEDVVWFGPEILWKIYVAAPGGTYITQGPHEGPDDIDLSLYPSQHATLWTKVQNNYDATWFKNGPYPVHLGTACPRDRSSIFFDNQNLRSNLVEDYVIPGDTGTFQVEITAPDAPGVYSEKFQPVMENVAWFGPEILWKIRILPAPTPSPTPTPTPTPSSFTFSLTVINYFGREPMPNVTVVFDNKEYLTDDQGQVRVDILKGEYSLEVKKDGFYTQTTTVEITKPVNQTIILRPTTLPSPYFFTSAKTGENYYLLCSDVTLADGTTQRIYYFSREQGENACDLPEGYTVEENPRTGLPMLRRI